MTASRTASHPLAKAIAPLLEAIEAKLIPGEDMEPGDIPLHWRGKVALGVRLDRAHGIHGALERLIAAAERELGIPIDQLGREEKQRMVALLDGMGAFTLRKSVEDVADALGVSRFTIYNYLNAETKRR